MISGAPGASTHLTVDLKVWNTGGPSARVIHLHSLPSFFLSSVPHVSVHMPLDIAAHYFSGHHQALPSSDVTI